MTAKYQRIRVRIMRVGPDTAHVSVPSYAAGQILVAVPTFDLMPATGMTRAQLTGTDLTATANADATTDTALHLHDWETEAPLPATGPGWMASNKPPSR
ncbi:hypothetical protein [Streptomyces ardesiacus]|uniref:hypothetical protein n=1 Tax=Streptomyces ardesiacus TaxID=285564 RepID=UPI000D58CF04|nr:hypothetical protein [Streptomyces ardesiacus]